MTGACFNLPAQEVDRHCRQLISDHVLWCQQIDKRHQGPCVHGDITQIMPPNSFRPHDNFENKMKSINRAKLKKRQFCFTHNRKCPIFGEGARESDFDLSGLPCPDHSRAGHGLGREGPTAPVFGAHAKYHVACQTPMLIIENVPDRVQPKLTP